MSAGVKKALLAFGIVLAVGLLVLGGMWLWKTIDEEQQKAAQAAAISSFNEQVQPDAEKALADMWAPQSDVDILDTLAYASQQSEDVVSWLTVPGTEINAVVMQGSDNHYYERRNEDGNYDVYGCYFADHECGFGERKDFSQNTVIYGHGNSKDDPTGKRFSQLFKFTDMDFAKKHPYIYLTTLDGKYVFEIFSVFYTSTNFDYIQVNTTEERKLEIAKKAVSLSLYKYPGVPYQQDRLLTLSTCSGEDADKRFVVMARLCPDGQEEKEQIELSLKK